ncbi:uncharacterized protein SAPINGB_P001293 [Magnusiomyces paraingens]|uniref:DNA replication licensing factor MCM5 n=1 Tax=Magnusiomyces paraingens TaxID=2606893 RepID=A0A5E8B710_9ASCO|nr:uncharacterized protein SAPINGB_P001293 [Saprochaete ingens]VVT46598.1 unnamed protein product [Saprochaete ingens]
MSYDRGRITTTSVLPGETSNEPNLSHIQAIFRSFILEFWVNNSYVYRDQLRENVLSKNYSLTVNMEDIIAYNEDIGQKISEQPGEILPLFEKAIRDVAKQIVYPSLIAAQNTSAENGESSNEEGINNGSNETHVNPQAAISAIPVCQIILKSNSNPLSIRELSASYISKLVKIPGIVISASTLSSKATSLQLICRGCNHLHRIEVDSGFSGISLPSRCLAVSDSNQRQGCPPNPYVVFHEHSSFIDQQSLKLQEAPDMVPVGEMPRHILLSVDRNLCNQVTPGTRCTVIGIYSIFSKSSNIKGTPNAVAVRHPYLRVVGIQQDAGHDLMRNMVFSETEEEEFINISKNPDLYEIFARSIAPSIYGNEDVKKAIACLLMGGSKKILPDGMRLRGDINVLLLGDPGTAKSQLLKFVEKVSPIAIYTSGKGSSAAGLTASVQRDAGSREFYLEGGAMVLADGGVVCIDEFDKMRDEDRVAIHEAMEQQTISIAKAGITTILNSRTSVLAAANPIFGRYDEMKSPGENIDFQTTILSRFDMIFIIKDEHNEQRDKEIAHHVMNIHMNKAATEAVGEIPIEKMKRYIAYCKSKCAPRLSPEASQALSSEFVEIRQIVQQQEQDSNERSSIPITIRQLEAIIRISESLAKLRLSPVVTTEHVQEAMRLFQCSTMAAVESGAGTRQELVHEVNKIEQELKRRLPIGWSTSYQRLLNEFVQSGRYQQNALDRALLMLERRETIQFRHQRKQIFRSGI